MAYGMLSVHYRNALRLWGRLHIGHYATTDLIQ